MEADEGVVWREKHEYAGAKRGQTCEAVRTVRVSFSKDGEPSIYVWAFNKGPRGGYSPGYPSFSLEEWNEITKAVEERLKRGQQLNLGLTYSED